MNCRITGFIVKPNDEIKWESRNPILAYADIRIDEMCAHIGGVALAYNNYETFTAFGPHLKKNERGLRWDSKSKWARKLGEEMYRMYRIMGGLEPPTVQPLPNDAHAPAMPVAEMGLSIDTGLARTLGVAGMAC